MLALILLGTLLLPAGGSGSGANSVAQSDSLTFVLNWSVADDGGGAPDSFDVRVTQVGGSNPLVVKRIVTRSPLQFSIPRPSSGQAAFSATIQGFRGYGISPPLGLAWRFPAEGSNSIVRSDPRDSTLLQVDAGAVSFGAPVSHPTGSRPAQTPPRERPESARAERPRRPPPEQNSPATPLPAPNTTANTRSGCSNEPPNYQPISNQTWEAVPPRNPNTDAQGWSVFSGPNRFKILPDPDVPFPEKRVIQGLFPQGAPGGAGPFRVQRKFAPVTAIYMCFWHKLSTNFTNNHNVGTKFGFFLTPYGGARTLNHYFNLAERLGIQLQSSRGALNRNIMSRFSSIRTAGVWHRIEILVVANTPGGSNGAARIWVDGNQVLDANDVRYFFPEQSPQFIGVTWNPTYGGGRNPVPYDMYQWIGPWYISGMPVQGR